MRGVGVGRCALGICAAAAMLAGCGGSQPSIGAPGAMPQTLASATHADRDKSWMKPGSASGDLLYVADGEGRAFVLTYPQGQLVGQLDFPSTNSGNICSDGDGDIFVPSGYDGEEIWEYAHGGTQPIATLREDSGYPIACAVDPTTGNLAVTNEINYPYKGNVAIYAGAQGDPTYYSDSEIPNPIFCGYDNRGNLFIDGGPFAELPSGSGTFTNIKLNKHIYQGGQVQWDSTYMTVASRNANKIYRLQISGSTGKVVSATLLKGPGRHATSQSWIQGGTIIAPAGRNDDRVGIWNYPTGGKALTIVRLGRRAQVVGATVSVGSNR